MLPADALRWGLIIAPRKSNAAPITYDITNTLTLSANVGMQLAAGVDTGKLYQREFTPVGIIKVFGTAGDKVDCFIAK